MRSTFHRAAEPGVPVNSFAAIEAADARLLVLGTMPGQASLAKCAYYAHPRNAFWPIMLASLTDEPLDFVTHRDWPYEQRTALLLQHRVALWDVLAECIRPGSLDAAIAPASVKVNDLAAFVAAHPALQRIIFNGQSAAKLYRRHAAASISDLLATSGRQIDTLTLPSTSPAMAAKTLQQKYAQWQPALW